MEHYRGVQPTPEARAGVARMPKEILAARPLLERLARDVPAKLGSQAGAVGLGHEGLRLPARAEPPAHAHRVHRSRPRRVAADAKHYIQEDAPEPIAEAIVGRLSADVAVYANASTGGHEHTRLRSPYAPSMRRTGGHTFGRKLLPSG